MEPCSCPIRVGPSPYGYWDGPELRRTVWEGKISWEVWTEDEAFAEALEETGWDWVLVCQHERATVEAAYHLGRSAGDCKRSCSCDCHLPSMHNS